MNRTRPGLLWSIAALAFVVRLGAALFTDGLLHPQLFEYDDIARNILAGGGFTYSSHGGVVYHSLAAPLPAWISAASYWLTGSIAGAMMLQIAAGASLAAVVAIIAGRLFGGWAAPLAAGVLTALHPGLVLYTATKSHPLAYDALFFTLALVAAIRLFERITFRRGVELGLVIGVGTLSRGTIVVFLPLAAAWLFLVAPRASRGSVIRTVVVAGVCATAVIAPWTIRNSLLHGQFVFLVTTDAEAFWRGNNTYATGHAYVDAGRIVFDTLPADELQDLQQQPDELAQARWFSARARAFIREQPMEFVRLTLSKFFYFWWFAPQTGVLYPPFWLRLYQAYYSAAMLLAFVGLRRVVRVGAPSIHLACVIGAFLLGLSALQSLYYVEGRHRWAVEPMVLAFSGGGVAALLERRRTRVRPQAAAPRSRLP